MTGMRNCRDGTKSWNLHALFMVSGILTMRIELSGLPETRRVEVGLNLSVVVGNSWALRIVTKGW